MSSADPYLNFAFHTPFKVRQLPGRYVIESLQSPGNIITINNCTLPDRYYGNYQSSWNEFPINWYYCDYTQSFGVPNSPIPDFITLCNLLLANRIPGPCQTSMSGGVQDVVNIPGGEALIANPGTGPTINVKGLIGTGGIGVTSDANSVYLSASIPLMQPDVAGIAYGFQDVGNIQNSLGYENRTFSSRSNSVGSYLPSNLILDESNVVASYQNFVNGSNVNRSTLMLHGSSSEFNQVENSVIIGRGLITPTDYSDNLYLGDFRNTDPAPYSICLNTNYYNQTVRMANESVYFGNGKNAITLNNQEFHLDVGCSKWFYHDLQTGLKDHMLLIDSSSGEISSNPYTPIEFQQPYISGNNCINQINNGNNLALVSCSSGPPAIQISVPTGVCQINSASLELTSLPPIVTPKPNILYYDPTSKVVNYAKCPSQRIASSLNTVVISNATAINTPFRTLTIPANTVASAGDILEFVCTFDGGNCPRFAAQLVGAGFPGTKISTDCAVVRKDKLTFTTVAGIIASFNWTTEYYTTVGAKMTAEYNGTNNINQTIANSMQYSIAAANVGITSFYSAVCTLYRA